MFDPVPSSRGFVALLEAFRATGGTAPGPIVAQLLEDRRTGPAVSLAKLVHSGQVFGFEWRSSLWLPMFQFEADDLAVKHGPQRVRAELPALWSGWTLAVWFATPHPLLSDLRPVDALSARPSAVLLAAQAELPATGMVLPQWAAQRGMPERVARL